jgi:Tol biopolymer transport system component
MNKRKYFIGASIIFLFTGCFVFNSCKKETSCEGCNENNKPPTAIAGPDQVITLPTDSISLDGTASSDPDGKISEWRWTKISGPASFNIVNTSVAKTVAKSLVAGTYKFELTVTDDKGASTKDTMMVTVDAMTTINHAPVAHAGNDTTITVPANTANLDGSKSTDPDNNITSYQWTKISGPSSFNIGNANAVQTQLTNLVEGVYQFELKVTDAGGLVDKDTIQVTVNAQATQPPPCTTNCGKIVFVSDRDGNNEIYTCNADGSNVTRLTNDAAADGDPAWSPDGTRIAFIRNWNINPGGNLYIMNADGSNVVQKTFTNDAGNPAWSPDGNRIAFTEWDDQANTSWDFRIVVINLTNGAVSTIPNTETVDNALAAAWSPDGTKIAFNSNWREGAYIFSISPQGSGKTLLYPQFINTTAYTWHPSWSPDGMKLSVVIHPSTGGEAIGVMNADGTGPIIIKTGIGIWDETRTSWSPDGTRIAYTSLNGSRRDVSWVSANGSASGIIITNGWDAGWQH